MNLMKERLQGFLMIALMFVVFALIEPESDSLDVKIFPTPVKRLEVG